MTAISVTLEFPLTLGKAQGLYAKRVVSDNILPTHDCPLICDMCERHFRDVQKTVLIPNRLKSNVPWANFAKFTGVIFGNNELFSDNPYRDGNGIQKPGDWLLDPHRYINGGNVPWISTLKYSDQIVASGKYDGMTPAGLREGDLFVMTLQFYEGP